MRLFIALDLPVPLKDAVDAAVAPLRVETTGATASGVGTDGTRGRSKRAGVRWARIEGLHLTLVFLGETPEARLPELCAALDDVARRHAPLRLALGGAGTFGRPKAPRVLWLGVTGDVARAQQLQAELAARVGVVEERPWAPHLTLARAKSDRGEPFLTEAADRLSPLALPPFEAAELTLFETRGGHYVARHRAPLASIP